MTLLGPLILSASWRGDFAGTFPALLAYPEPQILSPRLKAQLTRTRAGVNAQRGRRGEELVAPRETCSGTHISRGVRSTAGLSAMISPNPAPRASLRRYSPPATLLFLGPLFMVIMAIHVSPAQHIQDLSPEPTAFEMHWKPVFKTSGETEMGRGMGGGERVDSERGWRNLRLLQSPYSQPQTWERTPEDANAKLQASPS